MTISEPFTPVVVCINGGREVLCSTWQQRELWKSRDYTYQCPVWEGEPWWQARTDALREHFTHMSLGNTALLAYTADAGTGHRDIQTPIKPGKYLTRYFSDVLNAKQIAHLAKWQTTGERETEYTNEAAWLVSYATTPDEIATIYRDGPSSCMDRHYFSYEDCPARVYGAGDLAIAYLHNADKTRIIGRCLVWPNRKAAGRIYPTACAWGEDGFSSWADSEDAGRALELRLIAANYGWDRDHKTFDGARIMKRKHNDGGYIMPYMDGNYGVDDAGDQFVMTQSGEYECQQTSGWIGEPTAPEYEYWCEQCEEGCNDTWAVNTRPGRYGGLNTMNMCEYCRDNDAFRCEGDGDWYSTEEHRQVEVGGSTYRREYADNNFAYCASSEEYFYPNDEDAITMQNGDTWRASEFENHGFTCSLTGENVPNDEEDEDRPGVWYRASEFPTIQDDAQLELAA